ncbi:HIT domain-containing protein [Bacillus velezensis]|nr:MULTISPECIES: HIT domain-containing protein [Bacillus amyloliquefaciens group]MBI0442629.1 HIT domain-containing protein [Bacillus velezensis]MCC9262734.1 HIT domain-containing protein [Bacillus velezensis]MCM8506874.1 HIT domain-containing protein [Bacillus amyloliquefaciens]MCT6683370.1 HIT domain-containing protein [Bacillus velezensis]NIH03084.1 HIT domain-containing protein [Bacillus amyloliquefaciens]
MIKVKNKAEHRDEVLSGKIKVNKVLKNENVLAYHHTRPFWPVPFVVIPKKRISSLITLEEDDLARVAGCE